MKKIATTSFLHALATVGYISLVAFIMWNSGKWFGPDKNFLGPVVVLTMLVVSVLVVGLITLWKPAMLFWEKKQRKEAIKLVAYTVGWLVFFVLLAMLAVIIF